MSIHRLLTALAALGLTTALAACGGGGGGGDASAGEASTTTSTALPGHPSFSAPGEGSAQPGHHNAERHNPSSTAAAPGGASNSHRGASGSEHGESNSPPSHTPSPPPSESTPPQGSAPFRVAQGDNSIPSYGSEASTSERAQATGSLRAYLDARAAADWPTACAHLGAPVQKQIHALTAEPGSDSNGCAAAYAKLSAGVSAAARANPLVGDLAAFRVEADKAFALFYGPHQQQYMMPMVSEAGRWNANQIEPIPWPLGSEPASP